MPTSLMVQESTFAVMEGSAIGSSDFVNNFASAQVQSWCDELSLLTDIARSQPHAVFSLYIHGFASKWDISIQNYSYHFATL